MPTQYTDFQLIEGLKSQNDVIINYLYSEVGPMIKNYIKNNGGSSDEADDIFQEGIVTAYINILSGKYTYSEKTKFSTYLVQICKYKWYDVVKSAHKQKRSEELPDMPSDESISESIITGEKYAALAGLIYQLGDQCREILRRYYWEQESLEEISQALHMVTASVKNGKYRCMQSLRELAIKNEHLN